MDRQPFIEVLHRHAPNFSAVVAFDPTKEKLLLFDFTEQNKEITSNILDDVKMFANHINQKLNAAGAKFGIGGYNEKREVYSRSKLFSFSLDPLSINGKAEPRRIHLGIDTWGKPYTAVMSPLDGI